MVAKRHTRAAKTGADQAVQEDQVQDVQAGARRRQRVDFFSENDSMLGFYCS